MDKEFVRKQNRYQFIGNSNNNNSTFNYNTNG